MQEKKYAFIKALKAEDIRTVRKKLGLTQKEFAEFANVSIQTVARWEISKCAITGPIVTLVKLLNLEISLEEKLRVPLRDTPMRLWYCYKNEVCTLIDVDERRKTVKIYNYTEDDMLKAFGKNQQVTYEEYEEFLESRCFPRERDKMKLVLRDLDLPFYEPLMIIEKTEGRMAEDEFWIKIER